MKRKVFAGLIAILMMAAAVITGMPFAYEVRADATDATGVQVGDIIPFGGYNWRVLDVQDGHALILTENIIERNEYHSTFIKVTWAESDIRRYLNNEFYNKFTEAEQQSIRDTTVINHDNPWWHTPGGTNTTDKIFLLSINEVLHYFGDSGMMVRGADEHERGRNVSWPNHGIYAWGIHDQYSQDRIARDADGRILWWWLRSPGDSSFYAAGVRFDGLVNVDGSGVSGIGGGVRPALWLNLESVIPLDTETFFDDETVIQEAASPNPTTNPPQSESNSNPPLWFIISVLLLILNYFCYNPISPLA